MPLYAKIISYWVRNVLGVTVVYMLPVILHGALVSAAFAAGISMVSILQAGDWARVSTPAKYYFSNYITTSDHHWYFPQ